jgi:hypothetical protein
LYCTATVMRLKQLKYFNTKCAQTKRVAAVAIPTADTSSSSNNDSTHPVTAVLGMSCNPVAYVAPNRSSVLDSPNRNLDSSTSSSISCTSLCTPNVHTAGVSVLHVLHLYWRCLTSGKANIFPMTFDALIDHGSSAVLISKEYVSKLGLHHKHLCKLYTAKLAMENNGHKIEIEFSENVKLQLHDLSSYWSSTTVCAIIAPGLCSPMILGLPFLSHNDIVVNASACTIIDKKCNFNLLHLVAPSPPSTKHKL